MREAIENADFDVVWIKVHPNMFISCIVKFFIKAMGGTKYWEYTNLYFWICAKSINKTDVCHCDYLVFPGGAQVVNYLNIDLPPIIYYSDSCFCQMVNYYWFDIPKWICRQADTLEKKTIGLSSLILRSSNWAINSAINDYGCPVEKTAVLELGANVDPKDIVVTEPYVDGELRILFSGVDWKRKGGEVAVDTARLLNENGVKTKLFIVGIDEDKIPNTYRNLNFVEYKGFLNKNNDQQYKQYIETLKNCHCLLLPTRAECAGIVFCEAAAFGLPVFTYDTGGIGNYVINGKTGYRLSMQSTATDFVEIIKNVLDNGEMKRLHSSSLNFYNEHINWSIWSQRFKEILQKVS